MSEMRSVERPLRSPPVGAVLLALLAGLLYCAQLAILHDAGHSDAAGDSLADAFIALFSFALWVVLVGLMLVAFKNGKMPIWAAIGGLIRNNAEQVADDRHQRRIAHGLHHAYRRRWMRSIDRKSVV